MANKYLFNYDFVVGQDRPLRRRICACIVQVRAEILTEDAGTAHHADRVTWVGKVATPAAVVAMADRMILDILADAVVFADPDQTSDADPDGRIHYLLNDPTGGVLFNTGKLAAYNA